MTVEVDVFESFSEAIELLACSAGCRRRGTGCHGFERLRRTRDGDLGAQVASRRRMAGRQEGELMRERGRRLSRRHTKKGDVGEKDERGSKNKYKTLRGGNRGRRRDGETRLGMNFQSHSSVPPVNPRRLSLMRGDARTPLKLHHR